MDKYRYRPLRFFTLCFAFTWIFWLIAIPLSRREAGMMIVNVFMLLGLISPSVIAVVTVFSSKSEKLKSDYKRKLVGFCSIRPLYIILAIILFALIVAISIILSTLIGESLNQFSFTDGFSFSIGGTSALLTILMASVIEETAWRGYGEDSLGEYFTWFKESIIFGTIWALWHLPLFWIEGTYHYGLRELGSRYVLNFMLSVIPMNFLTTWVYIKNNRSMLSCIILHLFVNTMQEKIGMTAKTKCLETAVIASVALIIVVTNKKMFFERDHIGNLLDYKE